MSELGSGTGGGLRIGPRAKALVIVAFLGLLLLDFLVLRGETVARDRVALGGEEPARLELARVGEPHTFEITTNERRGGENRGRSVAWRLEAPDGEVLAEGGDLTAHVSRVFDATPRERGTYRLYVEENEILGSFRRGRAGVTVSVGDRRILARVFSFL